MMGKTYAEIQTAVKDWPIPVAHKRRITEQGYEFLTNVLQGNIEDSESFWRGKGFEDAVIENYAVDSEGRIIKGMRAVYVKRKEIEKV